MNFRVVLLGNRRRGCRWIFNISVVPGHVCHVVVIEFVNVGYTSGTLGSRAENMNPDVWVQLRLCNGGVFPCFCTECCCLVYYGGLGCYYAYVCRRHVWLSEASAFCGSFGWNSCSLCLRISGTQLIDKFRK